MRRRTTLAFAAAALASGAGPVSRAQGSGGGNAALGLLRTGDIGGLPWVGLELGGRPTRWLIDSGASTALVAPALATHLQLERLGSVRVATAGGTQTAERVRLPPLPLLAPPASATTALVLDLAALLGPVDESLDGLIGAPWLRSGTTRFDFAASTLSWSLERPVPAAASVVLPLRWDDGLPTIEAALGARPPDTFLFDTGNAGALVVFAHRARRLLGGDAALPQTRVQELGGSVLAVHALVERVSLGPWAVRELPAAFELGTAARRGAHFDRLAGSIGTALFEAGAVTVDGGASRLVVEQPGLPETPPLPGGFGWHLATRAESGLVVEAIIEGGPAARAGVEPGDRIVAIDGADSRGWSAARAWQALAGRERAGFDLLRGSAVRRLDLERVRFFPPWR